MFVVGDVLQSLRREISAGVDAPEAVGDEAAEMTRAGGLNVAWT